MTRSNEVAPKLAIIGTGIAGLGCAHFLQSRFNLTRRSLECGDLSPLSAGDLSPSKSRTRPAFSAPLPRGSASPTSRRSNQSGDKSPHSIFAVFPA